jgi:hypothetical protein
MASFLTNEGSARLNATHASAINWDTSTILKARLGPTTWSPNKDDTVLTGKTSCSSCADVALAAANTSVNKNTTDDRLELLYAATLTFLTVAAGETARYVVVYAEDAAADATRVPLMYLQLSADVIANGGNIVIDPSTLTPANVIAYLQQ